MSAEVISFGCRLNTFEGEVIRRHAAGLADTVVVNTCAVTAEAERQCRRAVAGLRRDRPATAVVVTGCAVQIAPARWAALPGVTRAVGNAEKLRPETWMPGAVPGVAPIAAPGPHPALPAMRPAGRARALLDVQQGCDHACTFCVIPQGRGPSRCLPVADAIEQARAAVVAGVPELVLTGVDLASYRDGALRLGDLVGALLRAVPGLPRLRLSSLDPAAIDPALWRALADEERLMPHLHLSLQSGAAAVLKRMRRRHSPAQALDAVARARAARPGLGLGADLIAGFPTETELQHAETLAFVGAAALPYLHVFPYSARPGTPASRMPPVPAAVARARAAALRAAARPVAAAFNQAQLGRVLPVVAERDGTGLSPEGGRVRLAGAHPPGALVHARIASADADGLEAD